MLKDISFSVIEEIWLPLEHGQNAAHLPKPVWRQTRAFLNILIHCTIYYVPNNNAASINFLSVELSVVTHLDKKRCHLKDSFFD